VFLGRRADEYDFRTLPGCATETPTVWNGTFWDDDASLFEDDIEWLAGAGVTIGCHPPENDRFCPRG
jgi:hypothetical protein